MRRIACVLLCLALCCALFGCGRAEPAATEPTGTEIESITEEETTTEEATTVFVPMSGESNGVTWRTVDLEDEANAEILDWITDWRSNTEWPNFWDEWGQLWDENRKPMEFSMGKDKTVIYKLADEEEWTLQILLRDNKTGKETLLMESNHEHNESPCFSRVLDDRFFLYCLADEVFDRFAVYDIKEMRDVQTDAGQQAMMPVRFKNDILYMQIEGSCDHMIGGTLRLVAYDLRASRRGKTLRGADLLADIPHEPASSIGIAELTENEHYYIVMDDMLPALYVFDLEKKTLPLYLPEMDFGIDAWKLDFAVRDEHTIYWFAADWEVGVFTDKLAVEITLP